MYFSHEIRVTLQLMSSLTTLQVLSISIWDPRILRIWQVKNATLGNCWIIFSTIVKETSHHSQNWQIYDNKQQFIFHMENKLASFLFRLYLPNEDPCVQASRKKLFVCLRFSYLKTLIKEAPNLLVKTNLLFTYMWYHIYVNIRIWHQIVS
jgi:hypothetical protein